MELLDALSQTFDHATKVVGGVQPDQLSARTPCTEWDVKTLLSHMTGVVNNMGRAALGDDLNPNMNEFPLEDDLGSQFRAEAERTLAAWKTKAPDDVVNVGAGPMPAQIAMTINLVDTTTHAWDVARATGQDMTLPDDLGQTVLGAAKGFVNDDIRKFVGIDPPVDAGPDAGLGDQLAAFMGRKL